MRGPKSGTPRGARLHWAINEGLPARGFTNKIRKCKNQMLLGHYSFLGRVRCRAVRGPKSGTPCRARLHCVGNESQLPRGFTSKNRSCINRELLGHYSFFKSGTPPRSARSQFGYAVRSTASLRRERRLGSARPYKQD